MEQALPCTHHPLVESRVIIGPAQEASLEVQINTYKQTWEPLERGSLLFEVIALFLYSGTGYVLHPGPTAGQWQSGF